MKSEAAFFATADNAIDISEHLNRRMAVRPPGHHFQVHGQQRAIKRASGQRSSKRRQFARDGRRFEWPASLPRRSDARGRSPRLSPVRMQARGASAHDDGSSDPTIRPFSRETTRETMLEDPAIEVAADEDQLAEGLFLRPRMIGTEIDQLVHGLQHEEAVVALDRQDTLGTEQVAPVRAQEVSEEMAIRSRSKRRSNTNDSEVTDGSCACS